VAAVTPSLFKFTEGMIKHLSIKISGRVQGVFFRASTRQKAEELGIKGFVRNEPDGSVYVEAEASSEKLNEFVEWCKKGPSAARVDRCEVGEGEIVPFKSFSIDR
jgi:acylphosphatase